MIESQAGIKFKIIGAPQPEDVIRASARGIMRKLEDVSDNVLELFTDASKQLTEKFKGDKDKALQACLAFLSGHYKSTLVNRSLLSGQEKQTTLEMSFEPVPKGINAVDVAWGFIQDAIPAKQQEAIKGMRAKRDNSGVVFDVWEDKAERFTYAVEYVRERDGNVEFDIVKCKALPELVEEEDFYGGGGNSQWRSQGGYSGGSGYGGGRGGYSGGYKAQGSFQGGRGGYKGGYDDNSGSGRGGYGRGSYGGSSGGAGSEWRSGNQDSGSSRGGYGRGYNNSSSYGHDKPSDGGYGGSSYGTSRLGQSSSYQDKPSDGGYGGSSYGAPRLTQSSSSGQPGSSNKVFVSNLDYSVDEEILKEVLMKQKVRAIKVLLFKNEQGNSKGNGIIEFSSGQDADFVVTNLNGFDIEGRPASFAYERQQPSYGGGGGYRGGRGGSYQ